MKPTLNQCALKRNSRVCLFFCLLPLVMGAICYGQDEGKGPNSLVTGKPLDIRSFPYQLRGADIPRYYLVETFLSNCYSSHLLGGDGYETLLSEIDIEPGSAAEAVLIVAAERYGLLAYGPEGPIVEDTETTHERPSGPVTTTGVTISKRDTWGPTYDLKDPEAFRAKADAALKQSAQDLADIYYDFVEGLIEVDGSPISVERYLYNTIAASTSVSATGPLDGPGTYAGVFAERLKARKIEKEQ